MRRPIITGVLAVAALLTSSLALPVAQGGVFPPAIDAQPFDGDLIITQGDGTILRLTDELVPIGPVTNVPGATGLAARGDDLFVTGLDGTVQRVIDNGEVLGTPDVVFTGLAGPEGVDVKGNTMYVVRGPARR